MEMETVIVSVATAVITLVAREIIPAVRGWVGQSHEQERQNRKDTLDEQREFNKRLEIQLAAAVAENILLREKNGKLNAIERHMRYLEFALRENKIRFLPWQDTQEQNAAAQKSAETSGSHPIANGPNTLPFKKDENPNPPTGEIAK